MTDKTQVPPSPYAVYGNYTTHHQSLTTEAQGGLLDNMLLSYIKNDVDSFIEFLNTRQQRFNDNAEVTKELYRQRQNLMAKGKVEGPATLQGLGMDFLHHGSALDAAGSMKVPEQHKEWAPLPYNMLTRIGDESRLDVARYDNKTFTPAQATFPQAANVDYGHVPKIGVRSAKSCLTGQTLGPIYTIPNRYDHVSSSVSARNGPSILTFMSDGTKHYRCQCGYESARKGDMNHHLESRQHSEPKYECSCGKKFTRHDSLNRHRKKCRN